jgi:MtaA/CmuA family methyltransferase
LNLRDEILTLLAGQRISHTPAFSGLISVTQPGLDSAGLRFHEVHRSARKMAEAAASTFHLSGFGSAVVPHDLCVEAEALGASVDFQENTSRLIFPHVKNPLFDTIQPLPQVEQLREEIVRCGRVPLVCEAVQTLKADVGNETVIGAWVPGAFTLLFLLMDRERLFLTLKRQSEAVQAALVSLTDVIARVANAYHEAGADFLTIHEMGGSPGVIGPARFETYVLPHLKRLVSALPHPLVLSVCGKTNGSMSLIAAAGADAISVDQTNDLAASRAALPDALIFGNIDPIGVLANGSPADVRRAVDEAIAAGADAVWPGCDIWPLTPAENLRALVDEARNHNCNYGNKYPV